MGVLSQGANKLYLFRGRVNATSDGYDIKNAAGDADAAAHTDALHVFTNIKSAKPAPQEDGTLKLSIENYEDSEALDAILEEFAQALKGTGGGLPALKWQDGTPYGGSSSTDDIILMLYPGPLDSASGKRKWWVAWINIDKTSGSSDDQAEDYTKPPINVTSFFGDYDVEIPEALFDPALTKHSTGGIGPQDLEANMGFKRLWLLKP